MTEKLFRVVQVRPTLDKTDVDVYELGERYTLERDALEYAKHIAKQYIEIARLTAEDSNFQGDPMDFQCVVGERCVDLMNKNEVRIKLFIDEVDQV